MRLAAVVMLCLAARAAWGVAQTSSAPVTLEMRLEPENFQNGLPQAFRFSLVNRSSHDVRVPTPALECGAAYTGDIWLRVHFTPVQSARPGVGHGCAADKYDWPEITERVKIWKTLHPGEALELVGEAHELFLEYRDAGYYECWADYDPPSVSAEELVALKRAGIDIPLEKLSSNHVTFVKRP